MIGSAKKKVVWNKCDICGRFIPFADFANGSADRYMITPDSWCSREEYETLCAVHKRVTLIEMAEGETL